MMRRHARLVSLLKGERPLPDLPTHTVVVSSHEVIHYDPVLFLGYTVPAVLPLHISHSMWCDFMSFMYGFSRNTANMDAKEYLSYIASVCDTGLSCLPCPQTQALLDAMFARAFAVSWYENKADAIEWTHARIARYPAITWTHAPIVTARPQTLRVIHCNVLRIMWTEHVSRDWPVMPQPIDLDTHRQLVPDEQCDCIASLFTSLEKYASVEFASKFYALAVDTFMKTIPPCLPGPDQDVQGLLACVISTLARSPPHGTGADLPWSTFFMPFNRRPDAPPPIPKAYKQWAWIHTLCSPFFAVALFRANGDPTHLTRKMLLDVVVEAETTGKPNETEAVQGGTMRSTWFAKNHAIRLPSSPFISLSTGYVGSADRQLCQLFEKRGPLYISGLFDD